MIAGARVVWWVVTSIWDETLALLKANVAWFLLSLPLAIPILIVTTGVSPPAADPEYSTGLAFPLLATGLLLILIPNPASLGVCRLATIIQRKESPPWREFWTATRQNLRLGLALYAIGLLGLIVLGVNIAFYLSLDNPALRFLSLLWLYLVLFWLALQLYLGPLVMLLGERRLAALYRRAALLVLTHPIYTLTFLLATALMMMLCLIMVPLYPALAMAFVALLGTRALGELKRKYDPQPDPDEESV